MVAGAAGSRRAVNIFGLRADYMQTFRDLLQAEGVRVDRETITLPVTWNFARQTHLKLIRLREGQPYDLSDRRLVLPDPGDGDAPEPVEMDLHSRLHAVGSTGGSERRNAARRPVKLDPRHVALFDRARIRDALAAHKRRMGWHNLVIPPETVDRLLASDAWYELHAPPERMQVRRVDDVRALERVATDLITEYAAQFWRRSRRRWEREPGGPFTQHDPLHVVGREVGTRTGHRLRPRQEQAAEALPILIR